MAIERAVVRRRPLQGEVQSIWRHPVKGFTPEPLDEVVLAAGRCFPADRLYAVENGPSGFDPAAPRYVPKQKFTVLANIPAVARVRTRYDDATGVLDARLDGRPPLRAPSAHGGGARGLRRLADRGSGRGRRAGR